MRVRDVHHEERPKSMKRLGVTRTCCESSRVEKEGTEIEGKGCHDASAKAQSDTSQVNAQRTT